LNLDLFLFHLPAKALAGGNGSNADTSLWFLRTISGVSKYFLLCSAAISESRE